MRERLVDVLLWTTAFVAIAVVIAAGMRIVSWIMIGETAGVWKAAAALIVAATGGGVSVAAIRSRNGDDS